MKFNVYGRNIRRTIFGSFGRYLAILAIIALGVGFFAGVKNTKGSMLETCNEYVSKLNMYDYRLISTYGFDEEDEKYIRDTKGVAEAEGAVSADFFSQDSGGNSITIRAHSITGSINKLGLDGGRMPEKDDECVADGHFYTENDIGKKVKITSENDEDTEEAFKYSEYEIVGIVNSPYYMMKTERGTTSLGDGRITAYVYMPEGGFNTEYYTEMFVTCDEQGFVFSDEYEKNTSAEEDEITAAAEYRSNLRFNEIISKAREEIDEGQRELDDGRAELQREKSDAYGKLSKAKNELDSRSAELESGERTLSAEKEKLNSKRAELSSQLESLDKAISGSKFPESGIPQEQIAEMEAQAKALNDAIDQIDGGLNEIAIKEDSLEEGKKEIDKGYRDYRSGKANADSEFASAQKKLEDGEKELEEARKELEKIEEPEIYTQKREAIMFSIPAFYLYN